MKRSLAFCIALALAGPAFAAPAPPPAAEAAQSAALQRQMADLQTRMNALAARMAALSARMGDEGNAVALRFLADSRRGMLGAAMTRGAHGWRVDAVTPGGPAARAGIRAGDTITGAGDEAIKPEAAATAGAAPGDGLLRLEAGKPVRLSILRGGKTLHLEVTPERMQDADWQALARQAQLAADAATARVQSPEFQQQLQRTIDEAMRNADAAAKSADAAAKNAEVLRLKGSGEGGRDLGWIVYTSPWFGLNLAALNPDLGSYFGTDRGALVLSRDGQEFPGLQPGDVITAIAGKPVADPADAQRALRAVAGDKPADIALRRHGKALTLAMKVSPRWSVVPPPPPPLPPPPAVPAAPAPPAVPALPATPAAPAPRPPPAAPVPPKSSGTPANSH